MVHVNNFLGCVKLETGGIVIAWLHMILYAIGILLLIVGYVLGVSVQDGDDSEKVLLRDDQTVATYGSGPSVILLALLTVFLAIICIVTVVIAYRSINAIKIRSHIRMFEMMALLFAITSALLYIFTIQLWLRPILCLPTVIFIAIYYYLFIVIYSLYRAFRKEYESTQQQKASA